MTPSTSHLRPDGTTFPPVTPDPPPPPGYVDPIPALESALEADDDPRAPETDDAGGGAPEGPDPEV